ncbi:MAG: hypothetical protein HN516_11725 [Gammaproteobacteria bacterium]|nr:hypothetical protein [Gammaproteobacteria bacterium]
MSEVAPNKEGFWKSRYAVITLCFFATFVCYIDRVNISSAIIPMAEEFGWDLQTQGYVLSSFYIGDPLMQISGGHSVNHRDIGLRHAGTLMGITNTAGTILGILGILSILGILGILGIVGVSVTGLILQYTGSWALVCQVTAGVSLFGMAFYLLFASGEKQFD